MKDGFEPKIITRHFTIAVDFNKVNKWIYETGKIVGVYWTRDLAEESILNDIQYFIDAHTDDHGYCPYKADPEHWRVIHENGLEGRTWSVETKPIELIPDDFLPVVS